MCVFCRDVKYTYTYVQSLLTVVIINDIYVLRFPHRPKALYKLGIRDLFSESADLTSLAPRGSLVVSRTFHQAALQVTEEGTEAAAATVFVSLSRTKPPPPSTFVCDRPFVFVIYDTQTGNFVFVGAFRNPAF